MHNYSKVFGDNKWLPSFYANFVFHALRLDAAPLWKGFRLVVDIKIFKLKIDEDL